MPGKELPDAPGESKKKQENGNPVQAVAGMTKGAATAGLRKARDWESGWIAGEYVGQEPDAGYADARAAGRNLFAADADYSGSLHEENVWGGD